MQHEYEPMNRYCHFTLSAMGGLGLTRGRALAGPEMAEFGLSDHCDQLCLMCTDHISKERSDGARSESTRFGHCSPGMMSLDTFRSAIDDLCELGTRHIEIAGRGEPMTNPDFVEMVAYAKSRGMHVQVFSCGWHLTENMAEELARSGMDLINVSLNAGRSETYSKMHIGRKPDDFRSVKDGIRFLSRFMNPAGSRTPGVTVSFVIGAVNYLEIKDMLRTAAETGAGGVVFTFASLRDDDAGNPMRMTDQQVSRLKGIVDDVLPFAAELDLEHNLSQFRFSAPHYLENSMIGPAVTPCYMGWYTTYILGNGCVLPCAQSLDPIGRLTDTVGFREIWLSRDYIRFRKAALALPSYHPMLELAECDGCTWRWKNMARHNFLRPWNRLECGDDIEKLSPSGFFRELAEIPRRVFRRK